MGNVLSSISLKNFFLPPRPENVNAYNVEVVTAVKRNKIDTLRDMHENGKCLDASNTFGESLMHMACRRRHNEMVKFFANEAKVPLRVRDDYGRTPMHDACWTCKPNLDLISFIIEKEPSLALISDKRSFLPFQYARLEHQSKLLEYICSSLEKVIQQGSKEKLLILEK